MENLNKAADSIQFAVEDLRLAVKISGAVDAIVLQGLIDRAANLENDIRAMVAAKIADSIEAEADVEADVDGWIPWNKVGNSPLPKGTAVDVELNDGYVGRGAEAGSILWDMPTGNAGAIRRYRLSKK